MGWDARGVPSHPQFDLKKKNWCKKMEEGGLITPPPRD